MLKCPFRSALFVPNLSLAQVLSRRLHPAHLTFQPWILFSLPPSILSSTPFINPMTTIPASSISRSANAHQPPPPVTPFIVQHSPSLSAAQSASCVFCPRSSPAVSRNNSKSDVSLKVFEPALFKEPNGTLSKCHSNIKAR
ncbi:hypothetical protein B0J13DRAFT_550763 [Dactylonectria estremocensis]|uniref:Uncharacterized protein n=1 Tax=Dactylonectria estremocensis TaxID=1079267 RepID=A0A9P9F0X4_9HYPO|nr:hypothetical protein B0J13DRAFT_550763 [Dactylonectria estremocensis]